jgi:hypothetical protein
MKDSSAVIANPVAQRSTLPPSNMKEVDILSALALLYDTGKKTACQAFLHMLPLLVARLLTLIAKSKQEAKQAGSNLLLPSLNAF